MLKYVHNTGMCRVLINIFTLLFILFFSQYSYTTDLLPYTLFIFLNGIKTKKLDIVKVGVLRNKIIKL